MTAKIINLEEERALRKQVASLDGYEVEELELEEALLLIDTMLVSLNDITEE